MGDKDDLEAFVKHIGCLIEDVDVGAALLNIKMHRAIDAMKEGIEAFRQANQKIGLGD